MKRRWNLALWIGFVVVLLGVVAFFALMQFPATRDFPWVSLILFAVGLVLLIIGLVRAFRQQQMYRGRISGPILAVLSLLLIAQFSYVMLFVLRDIPKSAGAPQVGSKAPDFSLPDQNGKPTALADLLSPNGAILIFYRGHW